MLYVLDVGDMGKDDKQVFQRRPVSDLDVNWNVILGVKVNVLMWQMKSAALNAYHVMM